MENYVCFQKLVVLFCQLSDTCLLFAQTQFFIEYIALVVIRLVYCAQNEMPSCIKPFASCSCLLFVPLNSCNYCSVFQQTMVISHFNVHFHMEHNLVIVGYSFLTISVTPVK